MAKPPRISCWLPLNVPEVYLLTLCQKHRHSQLANPTFATAFETVLRMAHRWNHEAWVIMPDHVHILAGPKRREFTVSGWSHFVKVMTRRLYPTLGPWQTGIFDRLLRSWDLGDRRWSYLRDNPVRANIVTFWWEWPYFGGSLKKQAKVAAVERGPTDAIGPTTL